MKTKYHYPTFMSTRLMALAMVFCTMGLMISCSTEDDSNTARDPEPARTYYMSVDATKGDNETASRAYNRALSLSGKKLNATWAIGEKVYVYAVTAYPSFWFDGSIQPQSEGTSTLLNGQITLPSGWEGSISDYISVTNFTLQFPRSGALDYTGQVGTLADIATKYDYAIATDVMFDIEADHIIAINSASFVTQQAIVKFTLKDKADGTTLLSPTALTITYGSENISLTSIPGATYTTNGDGVLYVAFPEFSGAITLSATVGSDTYSYSKSSVTFSNGHYYDITVKMMKP